MDCFPFYYQIALRFKQSSGVGASSFNVLVVHSLLIYEKRKPSQTIFATLAMKGSSF